MRVYHVKIQKVGRKWIELLVTGKSTDFKAKAEKEKMPDNLAVGDEIDLPGYIEANDSGYGRSFQFVPASESSEELKRQSEIKRWWGYVENKFRTEGYIYERGIEELHGLGDHSHDEEISQMRKKKDERNKKEKVERWWGYVQDSYRKGSIYERGINELHLLNDHSHDDEIAKMRKDINDKKAIESAKYTHLALGCDYYNRPEIGQTIIKNNHAYKVVSVHYVDGDGMSFGAMCEEWYSVKSIDITDTDEGKETLRKANEKREKVLKAEQAKKELESALKELGDFIQRPDNYVKDRKRESPEAVTIYDSFNIYGGGVRVIEDSDSIWFIQNNGTDGDNWSFNNYSTGGAGAIAWCIATTPELKNAITRLKDAINQVSVTELE